MKKQLKYSMEFLFNTMTPSIQEDLRKIWKLLTIIEERRKIEESKFWLIKIILLRLGIMSYSKRLMDLFIKLEEHRGNICKEASMALYDEKTDRKKEFFEIEHDVEKIDYKLKEILDNQLLSSMGLSFFTPPLSYQIF